MPRFFFHLYDDMTIIDEEGIDLPSLDAALVRARTEARQMACAEVLKGRLNLKHRIAVADECGKILVTVQFSEVVAVDS